MNLDYFKKIYNFAKSKLVWSMKGNSLDYRVYKSSGGEINPLPTKDIRNSFLDHIPCLHVKIFPSED